MNRRIASQQTPPPPPLANEADPLSEFKTVDEVEIDSLISTLGVSGGLIRILRRVPPFLKWSHVAEYQVEGFTLEMLKQYSGGGDYRLNICDANGKVRNKLQVSIDPRIKGSLDAGPVVSGDSNSTFSQLLPILTGAQDKSMGLVMAMMQQSNEAANRQMQMMIAMMTAQGGNRDNGGKSESPTELLKAIMPLLISKGGEKGMSMGEIMGQMKTMREFLGDGAPAPKEEPSTLEKVLSILGPVAAGVMQAQMNKPRAVVHAPPPQHATMPMQHQAPPMQQTHTVPQVPQPVAGSSPIQIAEEIPMTPPTMPAQQEFPNGLTRSQFEVLSGVRNVLVFVISGAQNNSDPRSYYDMLADNSTPFQLTALQEVLTRSDWFELLLESKAVEAAPLRPWFEDLRKIILDPETDLDAPSENTIGTDSETMRHESTPTTPTATPQIIAGPITSDIVSG